MFVAVTLGATGLNFLFGVIVFLFSTLSVLQIFGLVSGSGGLNWLFGMDVGMDGPILFSTSKKVFIFLMMLGCGCMLFVHGTHLVNCVVQSCLYKWVPCIDMTFTSTSTTSTWSLHLKNLCRKLHSGWRWQAILSIE